MSSTSKMSAVTDVARKEYLKKYLSSLSVKKEKSEKRKNRKEHKGQQSGKGLRLIEEDAFLPVPMAVSKQQPSDDEEDDESYGVVGDGFRSGSKAKASAAGPSFKASSFVTVSHEDQSEGGDTSSGVRRRVQRKPGGDSGADDSDSSITTRRRQTAADNDGDLSPVRRPRKGAESPDASPPRRRSGREHLSPPQHPKASRSPDDASPPRRPSKVQSKEVKREVESENEECGGSEARSTKFSIVDGRKRAGLVTMKEMREETRRLNEEEERKMKRLGDEVSGRNAETRQRATGFRNKRDSKEAEERKRREAEKQEELDRKYKSWNKGVAQLRQREQKLQEMEQTVKEGFARYADDKAMNEHLKSQLQDEDPMADYIKTKRHKVQMKEGLVYPTYKGHWPPNRFAIPPGYRWDGVNRSNGFEAKLASAENKRRAQEEVTYRSIMECED